MRHIRMGFATARVRGVCRAAGEVHAAAWSGDDEFAYEASAKGASNQQLRLRIQVKVKVHAP
jgi:hypothetical protein